MYFFDIEAPSKQNSEGIITHLFIECQYFNGFFDRKMSRFAAGSFISLSGGRFSPFLSRRKGIE
jgi:hypothetical protein